MHVAVQIEIDAPPEAVWADVARVDAHVEWMRDARSIRFASDCTSGKGTRFVCDTRIGPFRISDAMEITSWVPGREIGVRHTGAVSGNGRFTLEPLGNGERTLFRWTETLSFPWWLGGPLGARIGAKLLGAVWRRNLLALAARFSGEAGTATYTAPHIEQHSMLSDQRTVALVAPGARIDWMCLPRIDSPAVFAELLGGPAAGYFSVAPDVPGGLPGTEAGAQASKLHEARYVGDSLVLRSEWPQLSVTDYLDRPSGRVAGDAVVLVRVIQGSGKARIEFAPRLDFGRCPTRLELSAGGLVVSGDGDPCGNRRIVLRSPGVAWEISADGDHQTAACLVDLEDGPVTLELAYLNEPQAATAAFDSAARTSDVDPADSETCGETQRRAATIAFWQDWADRLKLPAPGDCLSGEAVELAKRSALTLKALCHAPTGAMAAAATTSMPEWIGGVRNWDYRYCWIRDAAMAASALVRLGSTSEALGLCDWLVVLADEGDELLPLYAVDGQPLPPETEIGELAGYLGSGPVRVGNAADHQMQIDVYGHVAELVYRMAAAGVSLTPGHHHLVERCVDMVGRHWRLPDNGMWEVRSAPRHHVNSKAMCWVAVDRAVEIATRAGRRRPEWEALAERIRDELLTHGCAEGGPFTTAYDGNDLDASALAVGLYGLLPGGDPRFAATVSAVETEFRCGDAVYRYRHDDGFSDPEGAFNLMTSWLIDAKILIGDVEGAQQLFEAHLGVAGPTGLMAEEVDPVSRRALGNFPQAYSHSGLIENVCNLAAAQS